jgi:lactate permease
LIFNTAPVAFGALGVPITVLGAVTGLPANALGAMVGRQLPVIAFLLPFYVMAAYGGWRSVRALFPVLLVAGGSFALAQFVTSNFINYSLTDVLSSLVSLACTVGFLRVWKPAPDPAYAMNVNLHALEREAPPTWQGWIPWILVSAVVIVWTYLNIAKIGQVNVQWPGLHNAIFITLYNKPYAAIWAFQPLGTGTAILLSAILTALLLGCGVKRFVQAFIETFRQIWIAIITVMLIVGLAFLLNYSGMAYTLGKGVASVGYLFALLSPFLGWVAVFLAGSDTSGNALFGNLQAAAAHTLGLSPVLFAATNSSGGVMGKMISPQNLSTGVSTTELKGQEGQVFAKTFWHSIILSLFLGILVVIQQFLIPWIIPG